MVGYSPFQGCSAIVKRKMPAVVNRSKTAIFTTFRTTFALKTGKNLPFFKKFEVKKIQ